MQLRKTPEQHFRQVEQVITHALEQGLKVNVYLEDWSNGMRNSFQYVHAFVDSLRRHPIERVMLCDTLGVLNPPELRRYLDWMSQAFPEMRFDFHGHNDYGMATANNLEAALAGANGVHTSVNGLGERTGNPTLCETVAAINDMSHRKTRVRENRLAYISEVVQSASGKRVAANAPVVGGDVYTQTCGVHADGDKKGNLYANALTPERFNRKRHYALGKLSGKASIDKNLETLGLELEDSVRDRVLKEVIRLGDKKKKITPDDLPFIIGEVLKTDVQNRFQFTDYGVETRKGRQPEARVRLAVDGREIEASAKGDGGYDALMKALRKALRKFDLQLPRLLDYEVRIPPGGKTDALVEATITWDVGSGNPMVTVGLDSDQLEAAIQATEKMLNLAFTKTLTA